MYDAVIIIPQEETAERNHFTVVITTHGRPRSSEAYSLPADDHKVLYWASNDSAVPMDIMEHSGMWAHMEEHQAGLEKQQEEFIRLYIEGQKNRSPEQVAEQRYEARAAMGPGVKMVNAITGERYTT